VAHPGRRAIGSADSDLHGQIRARVLERRHTGRRAGPTPGAARPAAAGPGVARQGRGTAPQNRRSRHSAPAPVNLQRSLRMITLLVLTAIGVIAVRTFVVASYYIPSGSMETTLHGCPGCQPDMVVVDKLSYHLLSVGRGDVVVFDRPPLAPPEDKELIKRVIGLPGDTVSGHDGHVYIGNRQLAESYVNKACHGTADFAPVTVAPGRYFVMGDNRCDSFDSRMFGTIARSAIVGRAFAVIWPVKHVRGL
jgi:signal peptidase I